ncbi:subunit VIIa of cytochrome c oxidase [Phycomyces blakesleeanus]|uniref:Cytochrome c oxidase subunit 9, mitochondrial n=2 Tax=Phycomyces blakesleeanus TaxID=4837 RepID=A0A162X241_PHYB8|nr:subunit VIIa of cytochrome c oxidase [Phycomyces blakesleeanus NRRL 1555(-)]OAD72105.1 subunit VIIa of cytochrome c oxidase [Phycomyces blakesleeanus NRRL 1555(-)]|eukprot:XP_018290145.1 subunit VIIa of cytochrome c oxidase [Phycomyces blakesleeanus NRRL 1555(-)]
MIAPITGKYRKQIIKDISISLVLGAVGGAAWWNLYHVPNVQVRDAYYAKLEASKRQ